MTAVTTDVPSLPVPVASPASVALQLRALRAGVRLVELVGSAAALYVTVHPPISESDRPTLNVQVTTGFVSDSDGPPRDLARLQGIREVAAVFDGSLAINHDDDDYLSITVVEVSVDGVDVHIYTHLRDDTVRAQAWALVAAEGGSR